MYMRHSPDRLSLAVAHEDQRLGIFQRSSHAIANQLATAKFPHDSPVYQIGIGTDIRKHLEFQEMAEGTETSQRLERAHSRSIVGMRYT